jgi:hypothetical protein
MFDECRLKYLTASLGYVKLVPICAPNAIDDNIVSAIVGCCGHFTAPRSCSIRHPRAADRPRVNG